MGRRWRRGHGLQCPGVGLQWRTVCATYICMFDAATAFVAFLMPPTPLKPTFPRLLPQTTAFAALDKAELGVWEALTLLDELREYEAVLMSSANAEEQQQQAAHHHGDSSSSAPSSSQQQPQVAAPGGAPQDMSLLEHALQTAELCRMHHPDKDWLHLVGLLHGLGKLLAHRR